MSFSCKIVLSDYEKVDGMRLVYLQAIIDRMPARVQLGFYLEEKFLDSRGQVKKDHPNHVNYNTELAMAIAHAQNVASSFRIKKKKLTPELFRSEFENPESEMDLIKYMRHELALRGPEFQPNTIKQHETVINKLEGFQKKIAFGDLTPELMQKFKNHMIKAGNISSTVDKTLKVVKHYIDDARKKGHEVGNPFLLIRIKNYKSNRLALSEQELARLDKYYEKPDCPDSHKKLLRYFLFSCYTGLRISDVGIITWNNIHGDLLVYTPTKTKNSNKSVTVALTVEKKYLPEFREGNKPIFETFSDPVSNRYLKQIARVEGVDIRKNITYHTSRHTFGTLMAEGGHLPETQMMMGHGNIKTTMEYVHTSNKNVIDAKQKRFPNVPGELK